MAPSPQLVPLAPGADRLVLALDVPNRQQALALAEEVAGLVGILKMGLELFTAEGPALARELAQRRPLFLDLKLHDIPNTVEAAARAAAACGAAYLTVHAAGGPAMVEAAVRGAGAGVEVLAVTVLTSLGAPELEAIGLSGPPAAAATRLARMAVAAGAHGLVCSARELAGLRAELGRAVTLVVPGIRPPGSPAGDQQRVGTPAEALAAGASLLVVGRPIRDAGDRRAMATALAAEIAGATAAPTPG